MFSRRRPLSFARSRTSTSAESRRTASKFSVYSSSPPLPMPESLANAALTNGTSTTLQAMVPFVPLSQTKAKRTGSLAVIRYQPGELHQSTRTSHVFTLMMAHSRAHRSARSPPLTTCNFDTLARVAWSQWTFLLCRKNGRRARFPVGRFRRSERFGSPRR